MSNESFIRMERIFDLEQFPISPNNIVVYMMVLFKQLYIFVLKLTLIVIYHESGKTYYAPVNRKHAADGSEELSAPIA